jgi:hypothetical protein
MNIMGADGTIKGSLLSILGYNKSAARSSSFREFASPRDEASTMLSVTELAFERMLARPRPIIKLVR